MNKVISFSCSTIEGDEFKTDVDMTFDHNEMDGNDNIQNILDKFKAFLVAMAYPSELVKECINDFERQ